MKRYSRDKQIYIGNSEKDAADFAAVTFDVKKPIEEAAEKASKPAASSFDDEDELDLSDFSIPAFLADPVHYSRTKVVNFLKAASKDGIGAFKRMPQTGAIVGGLAATLIGMIGLLLGLLAPKPAAIKEKTKKTIAKVDLKPVEEVKDSAASATASDVGTSVDGDVKKRNTGKVKMTVVD